MTDFRDTQMYKVLKDDPVFALTLLVMLRAAQNKLLAVPGQTLEIVRDLRAAAEGKTHEEILLEIEQDWLQEYGYAQ